MSQASSFLQKDPNYQVELVFAIKIIILKINAKELVEYVFYNDTDIYLLKINECTIMRTLATYLVCTYT